MNWSDIISVEKSKPYFQKIQTFLDIERLSGKTIFPSEKDIFSAFDCTALKDVKVVILGQDPYHNFNQAHGLSFSVKKDVAIPPSLRNIYKELERSVDGFLAPSHGCLTPWVNQGVFLLNTTLTVEAHKPNSHKDIGWTEFTDTVIKTISDNCRCVVFMLWGGHARKKKSLIDCDKHCVLETSHPSPLSSYRGFLGSDNFVECNSYLDKNSGHVIDWSL